MCHLKLQGVSHLTDKDSYMYMYLHIYYFCHFQKLSEVLAFPRQTSLSRYCAHKKSLLSLAAADRTPSFMSRIQHVQILKEKES